MTITYVNSAKDVLQLIVAALAIIGALITLYRFIRKNQKKQQQKQQEQIDKVDELVKHSSVVDSALQSMAEENTVQCYCLLACLKGLAKQGCDGPVHAAISMLEEYLNKKAHGKVPEF